MDRWRQAFPRRFDLEHTLHLFTQTLGWTAPRLRSPATADRWTWLVLAAYTQPRIAHHLVSDLRRPRGTARPARPADSGSCPPRVPHHPPENRPAGQRAETQPPRPRPTRRKPQPTTRAPPARRKDQRKINRGPERGRQVKRQV
ncbi:hypothetical protein FAIPA1_580016 [Frankia sp. AiPs1]